METKSSGGWPGTYRILIKSFAGDRNRASTRTVVLATVCERRGTGSEKVTRKAIALDAEKEVQEIATVRFDR